MNYFEKIMSEKRTENGDISYSTTGNKLADILFLTPYFEKHLGHVNIGDSEQEKLLAMYVRDARYGLGRRDLGRVLMAQAKVSPYWITQAGRFDDLWHIPTTENLDILFHEVFGGNELAKKWMPRLTGKDKKFAKAFCKIWNLSEKEYRKLIKTDKTVEYKLSYAEKNVVYETELEKLFDKYGEAKAYNYPLVETINFEQVPSLAMNKYLNCFSTREDIKPRFDEYMQKVKEDKAKINVSTANVHTAYKTVNRGDWMPQDVEFNRDVFAKKIVSHETLGVELNAICVLDTSGSMGWRDDLDSNLGKAMSVAHAIATHSTYAKNQVISFSSRPKLMTIKGDTLKAQYNSMYTGDCSNTDFGRVMDLLSHLETYPEYLVVLSDMEFDYGSCQSKQTTMKIFKEHGANTKIIWWNFNDRNKTVPEFDEYGNIYLSGYNIQMLKLIENKFDMSEYVNKILEDYKKKIDYK